MSGDPHDLARFLTARYSGAVSLNALFGSPDDLKFRSSMTLFAIAVPEGPYQSALDRWCDGDSDHRTVALLRRAKETGIS